MDERKNSEGYMDLTAFKAINHVGIGDVYMESNEKGYKAYMVLNEDVNQYGFVPALLLYHDKAFPDDVAVKAKSIMYGTPGKLGALKVPTRFEYIRTASDEEIESARSAVCEALGMTAGKTIIKTVEVKAEKADENIELKLAEQRATIYENLYRETLQKLIG